MSEHTYNLGGNACYLSAYFLLLPPQIYLSLRHRTWGFLIGLTSGTILEILGYLARVQMHFGQDKFLQYIVTLTIGPAFFSAAIYLCLARIIVVYGEPLSRFRPRTYTIGFMVSDFVALVLQASGGAIAGGDDASRLDMGIHIVQAGLAAHLIATVAFVVLAGEFAWTAYRCRGGWNSNFKELQQSRRFKSFLCGLAVATFCILVRTSFRVAELSEGFESKLAMNEIAFMVLEGAMVLIAAICLTVLHPGPAFQGSWTGANFELR